MLVSTRVLTQTGSKMQVARDWRVVSIPEEDIRRTDILCLYTGIVDHTYNSLEPYSPPPGSRDVPLNVCVADAVALFGVYLKFIVVLEDDEATVRVPSKES